MGGAEALVAHGAHEARGLELNGAARPPPKPPPQPLVITVSVCYVYNGHPAGYAIDAPRQAYNGESTPSPRPGGIR